MQTHQVAIVRGDGIGPEVAEAAVQVIEASGAKLRWEEAPIGRAAKRALGTELPPDSLATIRRLGAALKAPLIAERCGGGVVVDVRPDDRIPDKDAQAFAVTAQACEGVGWAFRRLGVIDPVFAANLRWLSRYRHPRHGARTDVVDQLMQVFASPTPLMTGAARVGDPLVVLPALFHLLWQQILAADLDAAVLAGSSVVRTASGSRP